MTYQPVKTDDGIEIRDSSGELITTVNSWPPRDREPVDKILDDAEIPESTRGILRLLFGVVELDDERDQNP